MDIFESAVDAVIGIEGRYSNDPLDPGGETMWGITVAVARANGYASPMRDMPQSVARAIYRAVFWAPLRLDEVAEVAPGVAREVFDSNVNLYAGAAAKFLQRSLLALTEAPIVVDGHLGPVTVQALRDYITRRKAEGEIVLLRCLNGLQLAEYIRQVEATPTKERFRYGWVRGRVVI